MRKQSSKLVAEYDKLMAQEDSDYPLFWDEIFASLDYDGQDQAWKSKVREQQGLTEAELEVFYSLRLAFSSRQRQWKNKLLYDAFRTERVELLNDALFQIALMEQMGNILDPGIGRQFYSYNVLPSLMASNRWADFTKLMPEEEAIEDPKASAFEYLLKALYYDRKDYFEIAKGKLKKKVLAAEQFLLSLLEEDVERANLALLEICKEDKRSRDWGQTRFTRGFSIRGHAYYNLAQVIQEGRLKGRISMPEIDNFIKELAQWQTDNDFVLGTVFREFPKNCDLCNKIMSIDAPPMNLCRPYQLEGGRKVKEVHLDTEGFKCECIQRVLDLDR